MTDWQNLTEHDAIEPAWPSTAKTERHRSHTARLKHTTAETVRSTAFGSAFPEARKAQARRVSAYERHDRIHR